MTYKIQNITSDIRLPYAAHAAFYCKQRDRCVDGTHTDVLDQIATWIGPLTRPPAARTGPPLPPSHIFWTVGFVDAVAKWMGLRGDTSAPFGPDTESPLSPHSCIFWINGLAGTGKTTIASTVAEKLYRDGILGASFFCSRDDTECSNPRLVFPTIAHQLALFSPQFKDAVHTAMERHPNIGYSDVSYQLEVLIVQPLRQIAHSFPPCIVVLDAIDECKDDNFTSLVLSSIS